jgi:hypothetical protein
LSADTEESFEEWLQDSGGVDDILPTLDSMLPNKRQASLKVSEATKDEDMAIAPSNPKRPKYMHDGNLIIPAVVFENLSRGSEMFNLR